MKGKRILAIILVLSMATMLFAGCNGGGTTTTTTQGAADTTTIAADTTVGADTTTTTAGGETENKAAEQVLLWNVGADPKTIDPTLNGASDGGDVISQTFEGLVREREGIVYPGIAESWEISEDGLTYTFHLRESKWSDGTPLTAKDFVYGWLRGMDPRTASEYSWIWEYTNIDGAFDLVQMAPEKPEAPEELSEGDKANEEKVKAYEEAKAQYETDLAAYEKQLEDMTPSILEAMEKVGVKAQDDHTLVVTLKTPTDYLLSLLSFYHFMPINEAAVGETKEGEWAKNPATAISNGPFKLVEYKIGDGLVLEKNEHYWNAENVYLTKIVGKFIAEATTAYSAYQKGEMHVLGSVPNPEIPKLMAESEEYHVYPLLGTYYYNFNLDQDMWKDARVRRAFQLAINREQICDTLATGVVPATGFIPPGFIDHEGRDFFEVSGDYGVPKDDSAVAEAQKLMAEAGYPNGEGFPEFTITYNTSEGHKLIAEMVQEMLKKNLGVNCKLQNVEWAVFQDQRRNGQFDLARGGWLTDYMDPSGMLSIFTSQNAYNDPSYSNSEYDDLLSLASSTNGKEHFEALYKAQEILMSELPVMTVYHYTESILAKSNFVGWTRSVLGAIDFANAYFVEE